MTEHHAKVDWKRATADFVYETYDRSHTVKYPGGVQHAACAAVEFGGKAELPNPEEMLVGTLSSCHMLTFLAISARSRLTLDSYEDDPVGILDKNSAGKLCVTKITLRPRVKFSGANVPDAAKIAEMHSKAHANCFIANSIKCDFALEPRD